MVLLISPSSSSFCHRSFSAMDADGLTPMTLANYSTESSLPFFCWFLFVLFNCSVSFYPRLVHFWLQFIKIRGTQAGRQGYATHWSVVAVGSDSSSKSACVCFPREIKEIKAKINALCELCPTATATHQWWWW